MVPKGVAGNPGPNVYEVKSRLGEGPKNSMHAKTDKVDLIRKKNIPGPGTYDTQNMPNLQHAKQPAFRMGSSERPALSGGKESLCKPGPGNYEQNKILGRTAPNFGFGTETRPSVASKDGKPGPGTYSIT